MANAIKNCHSFLEHFPNSSCNSKARNNSPLPYDESCKTQKCEAFVHFLGKFLQGLGKLKNSGNSGEKQDTFD